jgi:cysteine synthase A
MSELKAASETGPVMTLICDGGERYANTCYDDTWLAGEQLDVEPARKRLQRLADTGHD